MAAILSPLSIYGDSRKTKLPLLHNTWIHAPEGHLGIIVVAPSNGCLTTAPRLASMQALRSRRVSFASKRLDAPESRLCSPSLRSWFCGSTKYPDGFVVNHRKPCVQTPVVSRYPAPALVHDFILPFLPRTRPC
jgi:hypothetical protein